MDAKLVASTQEYEINYIVETYDVPKEVVIQAMLDCSKNDKPCRSRKKIYATLREAGYSMEKVKPVTV
jgi:hypothetical protein